MMSWPTGLTSAFGTEEGTLAALKTCRRELIDPKIAEHRGRLVKTTGDGALVEFASAVRDRSNGGGDEHTEGARDGHDPRNVRRCAQLGVRQANDAAVGPRQGRRPTRQVRSERGGGEREQGIAFQARGAGHGAFGGKADITATDLDVRY